MLATENSSSIAKSCLVLVEFLAMNYIKYVDLALDQEKVSSEKGLLENASKKQQTPVVKKDITSTQNTPVISPEILKKSEAVRKSSTPTNTSDKETEASSLTIFAELSLKKAERDQLPLEKRHRPSVSSSLGGNRTGDWKSSDFYPSKRHSTPPSDKPKRTTTMKLMNSTAANRVIKNKRKVHQDDDDDEVVQYKSSQKQKQVKPKSKESKEINLNLFDERPLLSQPSRKYHLNKSPGMNLQIARRYLKAVVKVTRKHRNTI